MDDGLFDDAAAVYPRPPHASRQAPEDYYLSDLRRRFARRGNPITAHG